MTAANQKHRPHSGHILLLLDTGNEMTLAKSINITRGVANAIAVEAARRAARAVSSLTSACSFTGLDTDAQQITSVLKTKLFSGKRSRLSDAPDGCGKVNQRPSAGAATSLSSRTEWKRREAV